MVEETFVPRSSSNIAAVTYEPDVENLTVEFLSGDVYVYFNVPASVYRGFRAAGSAGEYFHRQVRNVYNFEKQ